MVEMNVYFHLVFTWTGIDLLYFNLKPEISPHLLTLVESSSILLSLKLLRKSKLILNISGFSETTSEFRSSVTCQDSGAFCVCLCFYPNV